MKTHTCVALSLFFLETQICGARWEFPNRSCFKCPPARIALQNITKRNSHVMRHNYYEYHLPYPRPTLHYSCSLNKSKQIYIELTGDHQTVKLRLHIGQIVRNTWTDLDYYSSFYDHPHSAFQFLRASWGNPPYKMQDL